MFWNNTAHSGLMGLVVMGVPDDCSSIGGFISIMHYEYGVFSSTASSLVVTDAIVQAEKIGINLNIFGPSSVAHMLGHKTIALQNSLIVGFLYGQQCLLSRPSYGTISSSKLSENKVGIMMSSFNMKRSKMDGTSSWSLSKCISWNVDVY